MALDKGCDIRRAGYMGNVAVVDVKAQDGTFDWHFFYSNADNARAILAVALAAITTGKPVECQVDDPAAVDPPGISGIFLVG